MKEKSHLIELDALRGIACMQVVLFHYTIQNISVRSFFDRGVTGTDLFYIISGFVIFFSTQRTKNWVDFLVLRIARLYPSYIFCVLLTSGVLILVGGENIGLGKILVNLTMFQHFFRVEDIDGAYWSLAVEWSFYALIALSLRVNKLQQISDYGWILLIFVLIFYTIPLYFPNNRYYYHLNKLFEFIRYYPLFYAGILFYRLKVAQENNVLIHFLLMFCYFLSSFTYNKGGPIMWVIGFNEYQIMLLIYYGVFYLFVTQKLSFIINPITLFFGEISYPLYLIHQEIGKKIFLPFFQSFRFPFMISVLLTILTVILIAFLINKFIEKPVRELVRNRWKKHKLKYI